MKDQTNMPALLTGDVREVLRGRPAESVHCVITSIPYWGLRAHGTAPQVWGGDAECNHEFDVRVIDKSKPGTSGSGLTNAGASQAKSNRFRIEHGFCRCGAWRGELGQEPTPALFVAHLVEVFREVRRVLRPDGTLWLNMGDSYAGSWSGKSMRPKGGNQRPGKPGFQPLDERYHSRQGEVPPGLKPKDLCEIPSDVVRALRADGWWLRSRIPWLKRNAMPESTTDRPTQAVEYVFLLAKSLRYYYDGEAVKMASFGKSGGACFGKVEQDGPGSRRHSKAERAKYDASRARRNSDWFFESWQGLYTDDDGEPLAFIVNPAGFKGAHFAVFPSKFVEPMVRAGTSEKGCCPTCGKPWNRLIEVGYLRVGKGTCGGRGRFNPTDESGFTGKPTLRRADKTLDWRPECKCYGLPIIEDQPKKPAEKKDEPEAKFKVRLAEYERRLADWQLRWMKLKPKYDSCETMPCTVLDPFSGAGTTAMVASQLGRRAIGIDLSKKYNRMATKRIGKALRPATFVDEGAGPDAPGDADLPLLALRGFTDG